MPTDSTDTGGWKPEIDKLNAKDAEEKAKMQEMQRNTAITLHPKFALYQAILTGVSSNTNKLISSDIEQKAYNLAERAYKYYLKNNPS